MLTEQKPPCAAKFGVPYCCANQPVSAWLWSRPVKNASRLGIAPRAPSPSQPVAVASASSQEISSNSPEPRGPMRFSGARSRDGEECCMMPAAPLPQITPRLTG